MKYLFFFTGIVIGIVITLLLVNNFPWVKLFSVNVLKACFTIFLALLGGIIALYQVKANVISTARIKWIEEFKTDIAEFSATIHSGIFTYNEYIAAEDKVRRKQYHQKYMEDVNQSVAIRNKIIMNLDRTEPLYEKVYQIMEKIESLTEYENLEYIGNDKNYHIIEKEFNNLNAATHQVMKVEWKKAKKLF